MKLVELNNNVYIYCVKLFAWLWNWWDVAWLQWHRTLDYQIDLITQYLIKILAQPTRYFNISLLIKFSH